MRSRLGRVPRELGRLLPAFVIGGALVLFPAPAESQTEGGTSANDFTAALRPVEESSPQLPPILSLKERAALRDDWLAKRLDAVVPELMRESGVDMWIMVAREYLEDPVVSTMLNATSLRARRRTILIFFDPGDGRPLERLTVSRYGLAGLFSPSWDPERESDQWKALGQLVVERDPKKIAINSSDVTAFGDGLTLSQYEGLIGALPQAYRDRIVANEDLAVGWLETRIPEEMRTYPEIVRLAHAILAEGLSREVISPGETTVEDVEWWYRERIAELKLVAWFHPSVHIIREGEDGELSGPEVIQPGDLLWTDFGIVYLGLNTDTQHLAYVLKAGETEAPKGLREGLAAANAVQDALTSSFRTGLTGNEILAAARESALAKGLRPSIYSHPIGYHGHAAGASIGFWDNQGRSDKGEYRLRPNTAWSIELSATHSVPEWGGQEVAFKTEEDAFFDGNSVKYIDGRQTELRLIPSN